MFGDENELRHIRAPARRTACGALQVRVWRSCVFISDLFIWPPLMRCHSRAFTLHFYLMKVRKMRLGLSLWLVFFLLLYLFFLYFAAAQL